MHLSHQPFHLFLLNSLDPATPPPPPLSPSNAFPSASSWRFRRLASGRQRLAPLRTARAGGSGLAAAPDPTPPLPPPPPLPPTLPTLLNPSPGRSPASLPRPAILSGEEPRGRGAPLSEPAVFNHLSSGNVRHFFKRPRPPPASTRLSPPFLGGDSIATASRTDEKRPLQPLLSASSPLTAASLPLTVERWPASFLSPTLAEVEALTAFVEKLEGISSWYPSAGNRETGVSFCPAVPKRLSSPFVMLVQASYLCGLSVWCSKPRRARAYGRTDGRGRYIAYSRLGGRLNAYSVSP